MNIARRTWMNDIGDVENRSRGNMLSRAVGFCFLHLLAVGLANAAALGGVADKEDPCKEARYDKPSLFFQSTQPMLHSIMNSLVTTIAVSTFGLRESRLPAVPILEFDPNVLQRINTSP
ncbi:MAG: hypothetical protein JWL65_6314 [Gammaproteobacteria bacterium]|nr:hypothetical protein [Gammaproteobacteria bacterium]